MIYISVILSGEVEEIRIVGYVKDLGLKEFWDWFMEVGKGRPKGDTLREANRAEVEALKQENQRLKELVAQLRFSSW